MVRSTDRFWNDVEDMNNGGMKCNFCGHLFSQNTSISRIKWHLSGVKRHGVKICENVPEEVQDAARAAIDGPPEKRNKNEAGSSNNEVTNAISAPAKEQNNEVIHLDMAQQEAAFFPGELVCWMDSITDKEIESMLGLSSPEELLHYALETVPRTEMVQHLERGSSHGRTSINQADEPQGDSSEPADLLCLGLGRSYDQLCSSPVNNDAMMNEVPSINQADEPQGDSSEPTDLLCLRLGRCYDQLCSPPVNNDAMMTEVQNMVKVRTAPVLRVLEQSNAVHDCLAGDAGRILVGVQASGHGTRSGGRRNLFTFRSGKWHGKHW
jgi:hypothetical protein